jgi:hypothetical protein
MKWQLLLFSYRERFDRKAWHLQKRRVWLGARGMCHWPLHSWLHALHKLSGHLASASSWKLHGSGSSSSSQQASRRHWLQVRIELSELLLATWKDDFATSEFRELNRPKKKISFHVFFCFKVETSSLFWIFCMSACTHKNASWTIWKERESFSEVVLDRFAKEDIIFTVPYLPATLAIWEGKYQVHKKRHIISDF